MAPPRKKADRSTKLIRALGVLALALGVLTISLFTIEYSRGYRADKNADKLLAAYQDQPTDSPAPLLGLSTTIQPTAVISDEEANMHRIEDDSDVDESGDYVQPDAPDHEGEVQALIEKIIAATGDDGVIGLIEIPEIDVELPIIGKWSYSLLKISICRYQGPLPNHDGHLVLIGHNYKSGAHFGNLKKLKKGAELFLTDTATNTRLRYEVYETKVIPPDGFKELKVSRGDFGLTLLTCQNEGNDRLILRCVQKDAP